MLTLFRDAQGQISELYHKRDTIVDNVRYSEMLRDQLEPAFQTKLRELLSKGLAILHDNVRPHTAALTAEILLQLNCE
jgi:hypothetical protein